MEVKNLNVARKFKGHDTAPGVYRIFKRLINKDSYCLDIGAGDGSLIIFFQRHKGNRWVGIDIAPESSLVKTGNITDIPGGDNVYDAVTCTDVIEHLDTKTLEQGVQEVSRVLKPGGYALFSTLLEEELSRRLYRCPDCGFAFHRIGHRQRFSKSELCDLFIRHGLNPRKIIITNLSAYSVAPKATLLVSSIFRFMKKRSAYKFFMKDIVLICQKRAI